MKVLSIVLWAGLLVATGITSLERASAEGRKAMCLVCSVAHGETEEEEVVAVRTHGGKEYGFCSEKCAAAFDADPAAYLPPAFPYPAPAFALEDLAGRPLSNASLEGKVVLLDFWATWCAPCRKSMPELQALHEKYADRGFTVVGVSVDEGRGGPRKVKKLVASKRITYPIAMDSERQPAWEAFRVKVVPAAYLLDRDGRVVAQWAGVPAEADALEKKIGELLPAD